MGYFKASHFGCTAIKNFIKKSMDPSSIRLLILGWVSLFFNRCSPFVICESLSMRTVFSANMLRWRHLWALSFFCLAWTVWERTTLPGAQITPFLCHSIFCFLGRSVVRAISEAAAEVLDICVFFLTWHGFFCPGSNSFLSFSPLPWCK